MKKLAKSIISLALIIFVGGILIKSVQGERYNARIADEERTVVWNEVNIRETPSTDGNIICSLEKGGKVICSGKTFEYADGPYSFWLEVSYGDCTGWMVSDSVRK